MTATATRPRGSSRNGSAPDPDWPKITDVPVDLVDVDDNVRADVGDLEDLAESIRQHGVMQPISVALSATEGRFTLVVGQRRLAAAKLAGLERIPAIFDPRGSVGTPTRSIRQLVENVQRRDLNPLEEARALRGILDASKGMTQDELAKQVGRSRPAVTNLLRILELDKKVRDLVAAGSLSMAHAKALVGLPASDQRHLAGLAVDHGYSAHNVEEQAKWIRDRATGAEKKAKASTAAGERAVKALQEAGTAAGTPVTIHSPWNVDSDVVRAAVTEAGYSEPPYVTWGKRWSKCDCTAVRVEVQDGDGSTVTSTCVSAEHQDAANRESRAASEAKAKEDEENAKLLRKAIREALKAAVIHPTLARLIVRSLDGYGGGNWTSYAKLSDAAVLDSLADKVSLRAGTAYGQSIPFKKVLADLGKDSSK